MNAFAGVFFGSKFFSLRVDWLVGVYFVWLRGTYVYPVWQWLWRCQGQGVMHQIARSTEGYASYMYALYPEFVVVLFVLLFACDHRPYCSSGMVFYVCMRCDASLSLYFMFLYLEPGMLRIRTYSSSGTQVRHTLHFTCVLCFWFRFVFCFVLLFGRLFLRSPLFSDDVDSIYR